MSKKSFRVLLSLPVLFLSVPVTSFAAASPLDQIGKWDGITPSAKLETPYVDPASSEIPFGSTSYYLNPWRGYMDTWDGRRFTDSLGIVINGVSDKEIGPTAQILSEAGISSARLEVSWGNLEYDDPSKMSPLKETGLRTTLAELKRNGIRPLILLNANAGLPNPIKIIDAQIVKPAKAGDTRITLRPADIASIIPKYTGLSGQSYQTMFPVITSVDPKTGVCTLSEPLVKAIPAGKLSLTKLKYQPLSGKTFENGTNNPAHDETIKGWIQYVKTVASLAKSALGTENSADAGFDLEVWNELTFGSQFLDINNYYNPDLKFGQPPTYVTRSGRKVTGREILLPITVDLVNDPANRLQGVKVISGFSNQRPWDNPISMFDGQAGYSRHYYTGYDAKSSFISPEKTPVKDPTRSLDALGKPGNTFVPTFISAFPEYWYSGYKTENVVRDLQPFISSTQDHFRQSSKSLDKQGEVWMTENNFDQRQFLDQLAKDNGIARTDARLKDVYAHLDTKNLIRNYVFQSSKGLTKSFIFNAKNPDTYLAVMPQAFYSALRANQYQLNDNVRAAVGPQIGALTRISAIMKSGQPVTNPRPLGVSELVEHKPRLAIKGDGTAAHPDQYNRDHFTVLPYQLDGSRFAVGYYVMTRNVLQSWNTGKSPLDPTRYDMPPQLFDLTLTNVQGQGAKVYAYDPITGTKLPADVLEQTETSLKVRLETTDYPRFLMIEEAEQGPEISQVKMEKLKVGGAISFVPNFDGNVKVEWGTYPMRSGSSEFKREIYTDVTFKTIKSTDTVGTILFPNGGAAPTGAKTNVRFSGTIKPEYSEIYSFVLNSSNWNDTKVWIDGQLVVDSGPAGRGSIRLEAGKEYQMVAQYASPYAGPHRFEVYWMSQSQPKEPVPSASASAKNAVIPVKKGQLAYYQMPDLAVGDGVSLQFAGRSITNRFPQWDYDLSGILTNRTQFNPFTEVSALAAEQTEDGIHIRWNNPIDPDFTRVNVYRDGQLMNVPPASLAPLASLAPSATVGSVTYATYDKGGTSNPLPVPALALSGEPGSAGFEDVKIEAPGAHVYMVKVVNKDGQESPGVYLVASAAPGNGTPGTDGGGSGSSTGGLSVSSSHQIKLDFTIPDGLAYSKISVYRNGEYIGDATGHTFTDTNVAVQSSYQYRIVILDAEGKELSSSTVQVVT